MFSQVWCGSRRYSGDVIFFHALSWCSIRQGWQRWNLNPRAYGRRLRTVTLLWDKRWMMVYAFRSCDHAYRYIAGSCSRGEWPNLKALVGLNALNWVDEKWDVHVNRGEAVESVSFQRLRESETFTKTAKLLPLKHDGGESIMSSALIISARKSTLS